MLCKSSALKLWCFVFDQPGNHVRSQAGMSRSLTALKTDHIYVSQQFEPRWTK